MKNKLLALIFVFALILPGVGLLTSCGETTKYYVTLAQLPENVRSCEFTSADNGGASDSKGQYFNKDEEIKVTVNLNEGYKLGTLKVYANQTELNLTPVSEDQSNTRYGAAYTVTEDFNVTFSGYTNLIRSNVTLKYLPDNSIDPDTTEGKNFEDNTFIKFEDYQSFNFSKEEYSLTEFRAYVGQGRILANVPATQEIKIKIYSNDYNLGVYPDVSFTYSTSESDYFYFNDCFFNTASEVGATFSGKINGQGTLTISIDKKQGIEVDMVEQHQGYSWTINPSNNLFDLQVNDKDYNESFDFNEFNDDKVKIGLKFKNCDATNFDKIIDGLYFKASLDENEIAFQHNEDTVWFEVERPYNYASASYLEGLDYQYLYRYYIQTNLIENILKTDLVCETNSVCDVYVDGVKATEEDYKARTFSLDSDAEIANGKDNKEIRLKTDNYVMFLHVDKTVDCKTLKLGDTEISLTNNTNPDIVVTKCLVTLNEIEVAQYTIALKANVQFDKMEFFTAE